MIERDDYEGTIRTALKRNPVVMLMGPRQCGKTSLARRFLNEGAANYFDLERPLVAKLLEEPMSLLERLRGLVVLDEAQLQPKIFPVLRVLADRKGTPARFLVLGSASQELSRQASQSLAGRVAFIEVRGFTASELPDANMDKLWLRGGFPRSYLARSLGESNAWRENFILSFVERDLANLGFGVSPRVMARFWTMISHYHGQIWNASEVAASMGFSQTSARNYVDALEQTFMVRRLPPWYANLGKRLVKTPKLYIRDSGLFHSLQGIHNMRQLLTNPKLGASWEGFALEEVLAAFTPRQPFFYAAQSAAELDLFFIHKSRRIGVEFKRADAPTITRSMRVAMEDLKLHKLYIIYPGNRRAVLDDKVELVPLSEVPSLGGK